MSFTWVIHPRGRIDDEAEFRKFVHELQANGCSPELRFYPCAHRRMTRHGHASPLMSLHVEALLPCDEEQEDRYDPDLTVTVRTHRRVQAAHIERGRERILKVLKLIIMAAPVTEDTSRGPALHEARGREARVIDLRDE